MIIPPLKSQGIKTKLVPWIRENLPPVWDVWIEPFMGTGAVGFNLACGKAIMADANPCIIDFYARLSDGRLTPEKLAAHLRAEGRALALQGADRYYEIRDRFNRHKDPADFLFLNRACFNGMMRFNRKGEFNTPFCRKPERFSKAYVTKIVNQVWAVKNALKSMQTVFTRRDFLETIAKANENDLIYCDPPYIDRYADYYNGWNETDEKRLYEALAATKAKFILSTWHHNAFRANSYIGKYWKDFTIRTKEHFYHIGGKEENRNGMTEALVMNFRAPRRAARAMTSQAVQASLPGL